MNATPYDFRQPQPYPPEVSRQLRAWLTVFLTQCNDYCRRELHLPLSLRLESLRRAYTESALSQLPENVLAYIIAWSNSASSLLVVSRPLVLAWTLAQLGERCESLPADRPLTVIETSLWEQFLDQVFLALARESWGREPVPQWQRQAREAAPQFTPIFRQQFALAVAELRGEPPFADGLVWWLLSEAVMQQFFALETTAPKSPGRIEEALQQVPLKVQVQLGQVRLPLAHLQRLRAGDVLLLEQRLEEPLLVLVEGSARYTAWPGRVGSKQAVQIAATLDPVPTGQ